MKETNPIGHVLPRAAQRIEAFCPECETSNGIHYVDKSRIVKCGFCGARYPIAPDPEDQGAKVPEDQGAKDPEDQGAIK